MDIQLGEDGDIQVTKNNVTLTDGLEAIRQHIAIRFRSFLGEWFLDTSYGVPWFQDILVKAPSFIVVSQILKGVVLDTEGVLSLTSFEFDYDPKTRMASLEFSALTDEGPIDFSQLVEV